MIDNVSLYHDRFRCPNRIISFYLIYDNYYMIYDDYLRCPNSICMVHYDFYAYECRMIYTILDRANVSLDRDGLFLMLLDRANASLDRGLLS
ncbi:hypothetical protein KSS87_021676 [Heliosperma pusillum]|nr:hypothetical protein KSS87_021676 [Heliosperma pusillum]